MLIKFEMKNVSKKRRSILSVPYIHSLHFSILSVYNTHSFARFRIENSVLFQTCDNRSAALCVAAREGAGVGGVTV